MTHPLFHMGVRSPCGADDVRETDICSGCPPHAGRQPRIKRRVARDSPVATLAVSNQFSHRSVSSVSSDIDSSNLCTRENSGVICYCFGL